MAISEPLPEPSRRPGSYTGCGWKNGFIMTESEY